MFEIYKEPYKVAGILKDRVIFQYVGYGFERENPSYKIKFNSQIGYYVVLPISYSQSQAVPLSKILKEWTLMNEIIEDRHRQSFKEKWNTEKNV